MGGLHGYGTEQGDDLHPAVPGLGNPPSAPLRRLRDRLAAAVVAGWEGTVLQPGARSTGVGNRHDWTDGYLRKSRGGAETVSNRSPFREKSVRHHTRRQVRRSDPSGTNGLRNATRSADPSGPQLVRGAEGPRGDPVAQARPGAVRGSAVSLVSPVQDFEEDKVRSGCSSPFG